MRRSRPAGLARVGIVYLLFLPFLSSARPPSAVHYSYTSDTLTPRAQTVADRFTAFPCRATSCTIAQLVTDREGNTYAAGSRFVPTPEVFVAKLDPSGATIFLATFSGKGSDEGRAIALDPAGSIYVAGSTTSGNFPLRNAIQAAPGTGGSTGFLLKLSPDGSRLLYSTYLGGTASFSSVHAVAADGNGNAYVTGQTGSRDFPATPGLPNGSITGNVLAGVFGAFVAKLSPNGDRFLYAARIAGNSVACGAGSSCFLSTRSISGVAIGVDAAGNAYIAGNANVTDLPTTGGALAPRGFGAWVARIAATGDRLDYLTYLGSAVEALGGPTTIAGSTVHHMVVDSAGNAYLVGRSRDPRFPATAGAWQAPHQRRDFDAFVAKLNPSGTAMEYATFLGGTGDDTARSIAIDARGQAYVTGTTASEDFPVTQGQSRGSDFVTVLNPTGSALPFSSRYPAGTVAQAIATSTATNDTQVYVASPTAVVSSLDWTAAPATRVLVIGSAAEATGGIAVAPGEVIAIAGTQLGPVTTVSAVPDSGGRMPVTLAGTQVTFHGTAIPLLSVSWDQIRAVTPFALQPGEEVDVRVTAGSTAAASPVFRATVVSARPAIFRTGEDFAVHPDGTINSSSNPATPGSVVAIWVTGIGSVSPTPADGAIAASADEFSCPVSALVDSRYAPVLYSGAAPGMVAGVCQINFRLPGDVAGGLFGQVSVQVMSGRASSPPGGATLYVTQ